MNPGLTYDNASMKGWKNMGWDWVLGDVGCICYNEIAEFGVRLILGSL